MKQHMEKIWSRRGSYKYDNYVTTKFGCRKELLNTIEWSAAAHRKMKLGTKNLHIISNTRLAIFE